MYEDFQKILDERNLKAADVCRGTGLPSSLFSEWKKGKSTPKIDKMIKIADFLEVDISYLLLRCEGVGNQPLTTIYEKKIPFNNLDKEIIDRFHKSDEITQAMVLRALGIDEEKGSVRNAV